MPGAKGHFYFAQMGKPAALEGAPCARPGAPDSCSNRKPPPEFAGPQVLIAEDNPVNQALLRSMVERRGCRVEVSATARCLSWVTSLSGDAPYRWLQLLKGKSQ
jgi:hypothetical protein